MTATPNRYYIAPSTVYGSLATRPHAITEIIPDRYKATDPAAGYTLSDGCHYAEHLKAIILTPDPTLRAASLDDATITGDVSLCLPPKTGAAHYFAHNATEGHATQIASKWMLPATPSIICSFIRAAQPRGTDPSAQKWRLYFGGPYALEFGGYQNPRLLNMETEVAVYQIQNEEREAYYTKPIFRIEIHNFNGQLHIIGFGKEPWIVRGVGDLPASTWTFTGTQGVYAVNVSPYTFATSGYFETPLLEHFDLYADDGFTPGVLPVVQTGATVTIAVVAAEGTKKKYRVTLTGPGTTTPRICYWQAIYPATFNAAAGDWTEITGFVDEGSVTYNRSKDLTAATVSLSLNLYHQETGQTLPEYLGYTIQGEYAFKMTLGMPGEEDVTVFTGVIKVPEYMSAVGGDVLTVTAVDRIVKLTDGKLIFAPCVWGMAVNDAIPLLANWAGFSPEYIDVNVPGTLEDPGEGYDKPAWLAANGTPALDILNEIARAKNLYLYCDSNGVLSAATSFSTAVAATYSTAADASHANALTSCAVKADLSGIENIVAVEGRGGDGRSIVAVRSDYSSIYTPNTPRYVNGPAVKWIVEPNISDPGELAVAAAREFKDRKAGQRRLTLFSDDPQSTLALRVPYQRIQVTDAVSGISNLLCEIESISVTDDGSRNLATVEAVEVLA